MIELLVTIGIVVLVITLVVPNFGPFAQRQGLDRQAIEMKNRMLEAQALALAPRRSDTGLLGYSFVVDLTTRHYGVAKLPLTVPRTQIGRVTTDPLIIDREALPNEFGISNYWPANSNGVLQLDFVIGSRAKAEVVSVASLIETGTVSLTLSRGVETRILEISLSSGTVSIEQAR